MWPFMWPRLPPQRGAEFSEEDPRTARWKLHGLCDLALVVTGLASAAIGC